MNNLPDVMLMTKISFVGLALAYGLRILDRFVPLIYSLPVAFFGGLLSFLIHVTPDMLWPVLLMSAACFVLIAAHLWVENRYLTWFVVFAALLVLIITKVNSTWFFIGVSYLSFRTIEAYLQLPIEARNLPKGRVLIAIFGHIFNPLTLISGPISRVTNVLTLVERHSYADAQPIEGIYRVSLGLMRIYFLAMIFSQLGFQDIAVLGQPALHLALAAAFFQFLFVYYAFAGYCDIVIGIGKTAGYPIDENFNNPLLAGNIGDFWSRFHISLTSFLKDYFVNPLVRQGAIRFGPAAVVWLFLPISVANFLIIGLWHGWSEQFLYLGTAHAGGFAIYWYYNQLIGKKIPQKLKKLFLYKAVATVLTLGWISFATSFIFVEPSFWYQSWGIKM